MAYAQFGFEYVTLLENSCAPSGADLDTYLMGHLISSLISGFLGGSLLVYFMDRILRTQPYGLAIAALVSVYFVVSFVVVSSSYGYMSSQQLGLPVYHPSVISAVGDYFQSASYFKSALFWLLIVFLTLVVLLVNDKYGPGVFRDFLLGKYFRPKKEERIFMFLDLRSSTAIAEKIGEEKYFNLLQDLFKMVTPSIVYTQGEIYQYVGDEIIVSWKMDNGVTNANCIRCFLDIQAMLARKTEYFESTYSLIPEFKAGLHYGHVMAGEIGIVKKDITFLGDVLNTTSRIQGKCNELGVDVLFSQYLLDRLSLPPNSFVPKKIGNMSLKGKQQKMVLYTLN